MKKIVMMFLLFLGTVYADTFNISNIVNTTINSPLTNNIVVTNDIIATNITVNNTNTFQIQNTVTDLISVLNITNIFNNYITNVSQIITGTVEGITNLLLQPVDSPTNYLVYSNSVDGRIGYITYAVTNAGSLLPSNLVFNNSNNTFTAGTTQTFETIITTNIFLKGQDVNTNFLNIWNYLTNYPLTGVTFNAKSFSNNYVSLNSISGLTAYVDYCVTNGGGGSGSYSTTIVNFAQNAAITLTNALLVNILDNSYTTNETITTAFTKVNETCFDKEDVKHTSFFIVNPTNGYLGGFGDYGVTNTRVAIGQVMRIASLDIPIVAITNNGTGFASVTISQYLTPNTTQTISAIYGIQQTVYNTSLGVGAGTNDITRTVGSWTTSSATAPYIRTESYIAPYNFVNEIFIVSRGSAINTTANPVPEYDSIFYNYNKKYFRAIGSTGFRTSSAFRDYRIKQYADNSYYMCFEYALLTSLYKTTNNLSTFSTITLPASHYFHDITANSDGSIIYAACAGFPIFIASGNGDYIYKSIDSGTNWVALTNMGTRYWTSVYTRDGTNLYAGTWGAGGTGYSLTGGVFYSSDGGSNWLATNLRTNGFGSGQVFWNITTTASSNIAVVVGYNNNTTTTNQGIWLAENNSTNFYKWSQYSWPSDVLFHPTDTNIFYEARSYGSDPYGYGIFKSTNNLRQGSFITETNELFPNRVADYRGVCFSPVNPDIGYVVYNRLADSAGNGRILRTLNRGKTWTDVAPANAYWTSVATYDGQTVYAAVSRNSAATYAGQIYYSTNSGTNWTVITRSIKPWVKLTMPTSNKVYGIAKWTEYIVGSANAVSPLYELNTSNNVISLYGGRYSWDSYIQRLPQIYFKNGILYWVMGNTASGGYGAILQSYDYGETWDDVPFHNVVFALNNFSYTMPSTIAMSTGQVGYASNWGGSAGAFKTTNTWTNIIGTDSPNRPRTQVWCNDDGTIAYYSLLSVANLGLLKSTNSGSTWITAATNQISAYGVTSPDNGDTILVSRDNGTIGILTNMFASPDQSNLTFIAGSPSCYYLRSIDSNTIMAGSTTANTINYSTNKGFNWTTKTVTFNDGGSRTIVSIEIDSRDTTSNSYWMSTSAGLYYTTNWFTNIYLWATNYYQQVFTRSGSFCMAPNNTNIIAVAYEPNSSIVISTNAGKSYITPYFLSALNRYWTGITTYDGKIFYAASGYYAENHVSDYLYKIDTYAQTWSYLDNYRDRRWTDINTANGLDIWATTRLELHKSESDWKQFPDKFYSIITTCSAPNSKYWNNIKDTLASISDNNYVIGCEAYLAFSFDSNNSYVTWNGTNWNAITTNSVNQWQWWTGSSWSNAWTNTAVAALSDSMQNSTNRMTYTQITGIQPAAWQSSLAFSTNTTDNVYIGVSLRGTNNVAVTALPEIRSFSFNVERSGTEFIKKDDSVDYQVNLNTNNTQTVIKKSSGSTTAIINYMGTN